MPLGMEVWLGPGHIALDGDPVAFPLKGAQQLHSFRPMSIVGKRLPISVIAEILLNVTAKIQTNYCCKK